MVGVISTQWMQRGSSDRQKPFMVLTMVFARLRPAFADAIPRSGAASGIREA